MRKKIADHERLRAEMAKLIEALELPELNKQFLQLSGPYANLTHVQAYPAFAARVEELSREEVETYMTQVVKDKQEKDDKAGLPSGAGKVVH